MSIMDFISSYWQEGLLYALLGGGLIQISPLKWNPLSWVMKQIGRALNAEVLAKVGELEEKVEGVETKLDNHITWDKEATMESNRRHILKFSEEIRGKERHTEESYHQILKDIKDYRKYCSEHPDFENNRAVHAMAYIEEEYDRCLRENDFIGRY